MKLEEISEEIFDKHELLGILFHDSWDRLNDKVPRRSARQLEKFSQAAKSPNCSPRNKRLDVEELLTTPVDT